MLGELGTKKEDWGTKNYKMETLTGWLLNQEPDRNNKKVGVS